MSRRNRGAREQLINPPLKGAKSTVNRQSERKHRLAATTKQQASLGSNLKLVPKLAV